MHESFSYTGVYQNTTHGAKLPIDKNDMYLGNKEIVEKNLQEENKRMRETLSRRDNQGRTYLHYAVFKSELQKAQQLLALGFPVDVQDKNLNTALHVACEIGNATFVSYLLQQGANINRQNIEGKTALHLSVEKSNNQIVSLLLNLGANPNISDLQGASPLHYSAANDNIEISKLLVKYGAFVNSKDFAKETPLFWAIRESNCSTVDLFVNQFKADTSIVNEDSETPLSFAKELSEYDIILVLQKGNQNNFNLSVQHVSDSFSSLNMTSSSFVKSAPMQFATNKPVEQPVLPNYRPQSL